MDYISLNKINDRLKDIPEKFAEDILQYLEFLFFKSKQNGQEYELTEEQINLLEERSATPLSECVSADKLINDLKTKHGV